jgi:two-component system chemotaxis response regulator CheY
MRISEIRAEPTRFGRSLAYDSLAMRVLVVEDDPSIRDMVEKFLSPLARCDLAEDGLSGLIAVEQAIDGGDPYDLVCLDLVMPNMDGWEALRRIRVLEDARGLARVRVLILTARDSSQNMRRFLSSSSSEGFLLKPFRKSELFDSIKALGLALPAARE